MQCLDDHHSDSIGHLISETHGSINKCPALLQRHRKTQTEIRTRPGQMSVSVLPMTLKVHSKMNELWQRTYCLISNQLCCHRQWNDQNGGWACAQQHGRPVHPLLHVIIQQHPVGKDHDEQQPHGVGELEESEGEHKWCKCDLTNQRLTLVDNFSAF